MGCGIIQALSLRCSSAVAHHHTPKVVLRSAFFSAHLYLVNYTQLDTKCTPAARVRIRLKILYSNFLFIHHEAEVGI